MSNRAGKFITTSAFSAGTCQNLVTVDKWHDLLTINLYQKSDESKITFRIFFPIHMVKWKKIHKQLFNNKYLRSYYFDMQLLTCWLGQEPASDHGFKFESWSGQADKTKVKHKAVDRRAVRVAPIFAPQPRWDEQWFYTFIYILLRPFKS